MRPNTTTWIAIALAIALVILLVPALWMGSMMGGFGPMWAIMGAGGWWILFPVLLIVGIVLLIIWAARQTSGSVREEDRAIAAVRERYARGEIGRQEYERIREDLAAHR